MLFQELKQYFKTAELPNTLDGGHKFYNDVRFTAEIYIHQIETEIKKKVTVTKMARLNKQKLEELYNDLQDKSKWNAERPTLNSFYNKML